MSISAAIAQTDRGRRSGGIRRSLSRYEGSERSKRTETWLHPRTDPSELITSHLTTLVSRSRDLARKNPLVISAWDTIVDNVVGTTFSVQSRVRIPGSGEFDAPLNEEIEEFFTAVAESELEFTQQLSYNQLRALALREILEAGEIFVLLSTDTRDRSRITPATVELIPSERIDHTLNRQRAPRVNRITNGVEFDDRGRRVAYHVTRLAPDGTFVNTFGDDRIRIPADRMLHVFRRLRAGQERGIPAIYGAAMLARDNDTLLDTELTSAQVASCLTAFIEREGGGIPELNAAGTTLDGRDNADTRDGRPVYRFQPGAVFDMAKGDKVTVADPNRPSGAFEPFVKVLDRRFFKTLGISYAAGTGDLSDTSFSSANIGELGNRKTYARFRDLLNHSLDRPVYRYALRWGATMGLLPFSLTEWMVGHRRFSRATFTNEGTRHHDPVKEANAAALRVGFGLSSYTEECAAIGKDFRRVLEQRRHEQELIDGSDVDILHPSSAQPEQDEREVALPGVAQ